MAGAEEQMALCLAKAKRGSVLILGSRAFSLPAPETARNAQCCSWAVLRLIQHSRRRPLRKFPCIRHL